WLASNRGMGRCPPSTNSWSYYTRDEGLPSDQPIAIAFDTYGRIYVATLCDGIAMADAKNDYRAWRIVGGPDVLPTEPAGAGLPSSMMNDILVAADGTIYAATVAGLGISNDRGVTWRYIRGKDWAAKVRNRNGGPPQGWEDRSGAW